MLAWFLVIVQECFALIYFAKTRLGFTSDVRFTYAGLYIVAGMAVVHLIRSPRSLVILMSLRLWPLSFLIVSLGYLLPYHGVKSRWVSYMNPTG